LPLFYSWLAIQRRLYSQDKLVAIGLLQEMKCVFYGLDEENIDHVFVCCTSQKGFGLIFGIYIIFLELVGTGRSLFNGWPPTSEANI
jgi:hypothetical protein